MILISNRQGITLLELLVTLSIVIVLALLAIPTFQTLLRNHRLSATTENLYYALQYARSEAIKQNLPVYVSFQTGDTWCYGINTNSACTCSVPASCNLGAHSYSASGLLTLSSTFPGGVVQFEGTRGAANTSGSTTFTLYGQSTLITISVGRLGNLQVCSTGISGYTAC